jgi:hypothetical protein
MGLLVESRQARLWLALNPKGTASRVGKPSATSDIEITV